MLRGLTAAAEGVATTLIVSGPFGIGKTRLAHEALSLCAEAGFTVIQGRSTGLGTTRGAVAGAVGRWLRHQPAPQLAELVQGLPQLGLLFSDLPIQPLPPLTDPQLERARIEDSLVRLLERVVHAGPLALLLDDLHLADAGTWSVLHQLVSALCDQPVLLVLTVSPDAEPDQAVTDAAGMRIRPGIGFGTLQGVLRAESWQVREIELEPLDDHQAADLMVAHAMLGATSPAAIPRVAPRSDPSVLAEAIRRCGGRPLFVESVGAALAEGLGPTLTGDVQTQLLARIHVLEPVPRTVLDLLSVVDVELPAEVIITATRRCAPDEKTTREHVLSAIHTLTHRRMVLDGGGYDLAHAFLRSTLRADLDQAARRRLLAAVADAAAQHMLVDPALVAGLTDAVTLIEPHRALGLLRAAARRARDLGAAEEAVRLLEVATTIATNAELIRARGDIHGEIAHLVATFRAPALARARWAEALADYSGAADTIGVARAHRHLAELAWEDGETGIAGAHFEAAEQALTGLGLSPERAALSFARMVAASRTDDRPAMIETTDRLVRIAGELDSPVSLARAHLAKGAAAVPAGDLVYAARCTRSALASAEASGAPELVIRARDQLAVIAGSQGDVAGLRHHSEASLAVARQIGLRTGEGWPRLRIAVADLLAGDWDAALRGTSEVVAVAERLHAGRGLASALAIHGWVLTHRGRLTDAAPVIARSERMIWSGLGADRHVAWTAGLARATLSLVENDVPAAMRATALIGRPVRGWLCLLTLATCAEAAVAAGDLGAADELAAEARGMRSCATALPEVVNAWIGGMVAGVDGRRSDAVALLGRAADGFDALGLPFQAGRSLLGRAEVTDDAVAAARCASDALRVLDTLGAPIQTQQARTLLRRLGVTPARGRARDQAIVGLSRRELEVARLVAVGLHNSEIATRLFISPRTVSTHLEHIYHRLGLSSRTALTRYLADSGLLDGRRD